MKFFWKIYFSFTVLFLVSFGLFGAWMIQVTFEKSYQKVLEEGERDSRMFQLASEMNMNAMAAAYQNDGMISVAAGSVIENLAGSGDIYRIYGNYKLIYESQESDVQSGLWLELTEEKPSGYTLARDGNRTWLVYACRSDLGPRVFYLENLTDISEIYRDRESYYDMYTVVVLILTAVTAVLVYLITRILTRSIHELSHTARGFTGGDYTARALEQGGDEIAGLAHDFNEMADTISEKMQELEDQAKRQEDFTASFAHELKTPLTSIIGYADMLRTVDCTKEETFEAVNYIFWQGKRLESLSFKLLELIVAEKQEYDFRTLKAEELVQDAVELTRTGREEKNIRLTMNLKEGTVTGDRDLLVPVFTSLLDNARKAVPEQGRIHIRGRGHAGGYLFSVSDNGCGMEEKELSRITEAFYMVDKSRARKEGGAGLGMTLCSRILDLHDAQWKISSVPGKGTTIALWFPGEKGEEQA